jgi:hypothetical protein
MATRPALELAMLANAHAHGRRMMELGGQTLSLLLAVGAALFSKAE